MVSTRTDLHIRSLILQYGGNIADVLVDAVSTDNYPLVNSLLDYDPSLINKYGNSILVGSLSVNDIEMVQLLINHKVDINSNNGRALLTAVNNGAYQCVKLLLKTGANIHVRNNKSFQYAIAHSDPSMLNLLLEYHEESSEKELLTKYLHRIKPNENLIIILIKTKY